MKDRKSPFAPPRQTSNHQPGLFDEAYDIFERMKNEAIRRAETDQAHASTRGLFTKLILALTLISALCAIATGIYGVYNFPDAPLRPSGNGYVGKRGSPHTQAEYEAFQTWKRALLITFPTTFILGFAFAIADRKKQREQ